MKQIITNIAILISACSLALVGCSSNTQNENTGVGTVAGAVVGGLAGSAFGAGAGKAVAVGVGAVAGALVGGWIGHSMDHSDNAAMCHTLNSNHTNQSSSWKNKKSGARYTMKPTSDVMAYQGHNTCRQYEMTAVSGDKKDTTNGIACKNNNGAWSTVSQS